MWARTELDFLESLASIEAYIIYISDGDSRSHRNSHRATIYMSAENSLEQDDIESILHEIVNVTSDRGSQRTQHIRSRLESGDVSFAFLEAVLTVEAKLRESNDAQGARFSQLVHFSGDHLRPGEAELLREAYRLRSEFLHKGVHPPRDQAIRLTNSILQIIDRI